MAETCRPLLYEVLFMSEFITHSRAETVALGRRMAGVLQPGALIAYTGGLGAGKTAFTEGLAEGLGCTDPVSSPTFAIVNYYRGRGGLLRLSGSGGHRGGRVERKFCKSAGPGKPHPGGHPASG